jgi:hypothetical protein
MGLWVSDALDLMTIGSAIPVANDRNDKAALLITQK